jgi:hypothetical protein
MNEQKTDFMTVSRNIQKGQNKNISMEPTVLR